MIKNFLLFAFIGCLFISGSVFSQSAPLSDLDWTGINPSTGLKSDFVILNSGQKIFGQLIRNYDLAYYDEIVLETGGSSTTYSPKDIKGFGLMNGQLFQSRALPDSSELLFIQILFSGPLELSSYRGNYFLDNGVSFQKLEAYYKKENVDGYERSKFYKPFILTLKTNLAGDCGVALYSKIERLPYSEQAFIGLLESYFSCQGVAYQVHVENAPFLKISPLVGMGVTYFSLTTSQKNDGRNDQLENNLGYQGFIGVRLHDFRNLPRLSADLRIGFSMFSTTVLSSYAGSRFNWTGSEEMEEFAVYLPVSLNYSVLKNQQSELYFGVSGGFWLMQTSLTGGRIDRINLTSNEIQIEESDLVQVPGTKFIPGLKVGYNLALGSKIRLLMELEGTTQKDFYLFSLEKDQSKHSRSRVSFQIGLEF